MVKVIFWYILFCMLYAAITYTNDLPSFAKGQVYDLKEPSVLDLSDNLSLYVINDYVNNVILPARQFFFYENEYQNNGASLDSLMHLFYLILPPIFIYKQLKVLYSSWNLFFAVVACATCCIVAMYIISVIYDRFFRLESFDLSEKDLRDQFSHYNETFPISDRKSFNNYVIDRYLGYYCSVSKRASRRKTFGKFFNGVLLIIYFLFFYTTPYD